MSRRKEEREEYSKGKRKEKATRTSSRHSKCVERASSS